MELLAIFRKLLAASYAKNRDIPWMGGHDEGTYLTAWREYFLCTHDPTVTKYVLEKLAEYDEWAKKNFSHGYYPKHEVHHGVENFVIFLPWILEMDSQNEIARHLLRDAAENLIHPPNNLRWFDWETNRFTSCYLGTVEINPNLSVNIPEHFRMIRLAWLGLASGGDQELRKLILNYCTEWAQKIVHSEILPFYLPQSEDTSPENDIHFQQALKKFIGAAPKEITNNTRAEYHIANGVPDLFIALYEKTNNSLFLDAAECIVRPVLSQLNSPYAHPLGEIIWHLYSLGKLADLSEIIPAFQTAIEPLFGSSYKLSFQNCFVWKKSPYHNTIGIRPDMLALKIRGENRFRPIEIPSPASLGLLYRVTGEDNYLILAMEYARAVLEEGRRRFQEGRNHGCSSRVIHSVCIGHGRNWGAGFTSTALRAAIGPKCFNIPLPDLPM